MLLFVVNIRKSLGYKHNVVLVFFGFLAKRCRTKRQKIFLRNNRTEDTMPRGGQQTAEPPRLHRPQMIDDDKKINEKIDRIIAEQMQVKKVKAVAKKAFTCPYCSKQFKSENLRHLLGCAKANANDKEKLVAFFNVVG